MLEKIKNIHAELEAAVAEDAAAVEALRIMIYQNLLSQISHTS